MQPLKRLTWTLQETVERRCDRGWKQLAHGLLEVLPRLKKRIIPPAPCSVRCQLVQHIGWMKLLLADFDRPVCGLAPFAIVLFVQSAAARNEGLVRIKTLCFQLVTRPRIAHGRTPTVPDSKWGSR